VHTYLEANNTSQNSKEKTTTENILNALDFRRTFFTISSDGHYFD